MRLSKTDCGLKGNNMELTREQLTKWQEHIIGKRCQKHPTHTVKEGKYGLWCGVKTAFGWCDGGWPTEEWLKENL